MTSTTTVTKSPDHPESPYGNTNHQLFPAALVIPSPIMHSSSTRRQCDPDRMMAALSRDNASLVSEIQNLRSHQEQLLTQLGEKSTTILALQREKSTYEWRITRLKEENKRLLDREDRFVEEVERLEKHVRNLEGENFQLCHKRQKNLKFASLNVVKDQGATVRKPMEIVTCVPDDTSSSFFQHATNQLVALPEEPGKLNYRSIRQTKSEMMSKESYSKGSIGKDSSVVNKKSATIDLSVALRARIRFLEDSLAMSNAELAKVKDEFASTTNDSTQDNDDLDALKNSVGKAEVKMAQLQNDLAEANTKCTTLEKRLQAAETEKSELAEKLAAEELGAATWKTQLETIKRQNLALGKQASESMASLRNELASTQSENVRLRQDLAKAEGIVQRAMAAWHTKRVQTQSYNAALHRNLKTNSSADDSLHNELAQTGNQSVGFSDKSNKATLLGTDATESIASVRTELANAKNESARLHEELKLAHKTCNSLEIMFTHLEERDCALVHQMSSHITELQTEIDRQHKVISDKGKALEAKLCHVSKLTAQVNSLHQRIANITQLSAVGGPLPSKPQLVTLRLE